MTLRRLVFSLVGVAALCGSAMASPPDRFVPEGRELDPVARDFFAAPPGASETPTPSRTAERPANTAEGSFVSWLLEALNTLTIPLGTVQPRLSR